MSTSKIQAWDELRGAYTHLTHIHCCIGSLQVVWLAPSRDRLPLLSLRSTSELLISWDILHYLGLPQHLTVCFASIPAYILRCLQFRSGEIESLTCRRFVFLNRFNPFWTTLLIGGNFWGKSMSHKRNGSSSEDSLPSCHSILFSSSGCIFSGVFTGVMFGGIVFLFLWDESQVAALAMLAVMCGMLYRQYLYTTMSLRLSACTHPCLLIYPVLIITWLIRVILVFIIYLRMSITFTREKPGRANIAVLMFESWNAGNAIGYVL